MSFELVISFLIASIILSLMPGPDNIFVLTESITKGAKNGVLISIGLSSGILFHTLAAATGLSFIIQNSAIAFSLLKYLGAAYLFFLAYKSTKEDKHIIELNDSSTDIKESSFSLIRKGILMNVLNPKVSLFFIAFLPQFITKDGYDITLQMILLGLIFMIQAVIIFSLIAILSGKLKKYVNNSRQVCKMYKYNTYNRINVII